MKEVYLNLMHKVRGQADKKVSVSLSAGEMVVFRRLSEVRTKVDGAVPCMPHLDAQPAPVVSSLVGSRFGFLCHLHQKECLLV